MESNCPVTVQAISIIRYQVQTHMLLITEGVATRQMKPNLERIWSSVWHGHREGIQRHIQLH